MRFLTLIVAASTLVGACVPGDVVFIPLPSEGLGALVLGIERPDHAPRFLARAVDVQSKDIVIRLPDLIDRDEVVRLEALFYSESLSALNLPSGPLTPAATRTAGRALPSTDDVFQLQLPNGAPAWERRDTPSDVVANYRIVDTGPRDCATFVAEPFSLGDPSNTEMALTISSTVVLVGQLSGKLLRWTPDGLEEIRMRPPIVLSHGVRDEMDGDWWFMTRPGLLYRGRFITPTELDLTFVTRTTDPGTVTGRHRIALRYEAGEPQIYSMRSDGLFERFEASGTTSLHQFEDGDFGAHTILTPEGDIIAAASGNTTVARVTPDGTLRIEAVPAEAGFTAAAYVDGIGTVLGSSDGRFFVGRDGTWSEVGRSPLTVFPHAIAGYDGGFVFGGAFGAGGQYVPEGYCAIQDQLAAFTVQMVVVVDDGVLMFGQNPNVDETPGQLVRLLP